MSTNPNPLQCLHDAIARIHHELRTRTWLSIHEVLGDDGQEYQTLNLRHHILVSTSMQVWQEDRVHHTKNAKPAKSIQHLPRQQFVQGRLLSPIRHQIWLRRSKRQTRQTTNNTKTSSKLLGPLGQVIVYWEQRHPDHSLHRIRTTSNNQPARVFNSLSV